MPPIETCGKPRGRGASAPALVAVLVLLLAALAGCRGDEPGTDGGGPEAVRVAVPEPDLSGAQAAVREQIGERREALATALERDAPAAEVAEAYGALGLVYIPYDFLSAAEACFENARALAPGDYRWAYLAGYLRRLQGRLAEAIPLFERTIELEPRFLPAVLRLAQTRFELGELEAAEALFERALEIEPAAAAAHEGLGRVAASRGDDRAAAERFERALELEPAASGVRYALGQAYRNLGDLERAEEHLARSGDVAARIPDPLINPLAALAAGGQFYLVQGAEALDDGDFGRAAGSYREAVERDPESFDAYRGWAHSLERLGDAAGAIDALERGIAAAADDDPAADARQRANLLAQLGGLHAAEGRDEAAIAAWRRSLELAPDDPGIHLRLADALARGRRFAEAVEHYDRVVELAPEHAAAVLEKRAMALVNLGRGAEAVADFRRTIEASPGDPRLRLRFAEALEFLGDAAGAATERRAAERLGSGAGGDAAAVRLALAQGRAALAEGDAAAAEAAYRRALAAAPESAEARYGLASVLGHTGRFDQAAAEFTRLIEAAPRHGPAHRGRIIALVLAGRWGEARVALQAALAEFPRDAELALTQVRLLSTAPDASVRDGELALEIARRVAAEHPDDRSVREALALAHAEAGQLDLALALQSELGAGPGASVDGLAAARLAAFEAGKAWVARGPEEILVELAG